MRFKRDEVVSVLQGNWARGVILGAVFFALSGCKMFVKEDPPPCPRVSILGEAESLTRFRSGAGRDITDIQMQAKIVDYHGSCFYDKDSRKMTVTMQVGIDVQRGSAWSEGTHRLEYFVSVPAFFPFEGAKKVLPMAVQFDKNVESQHLTDRDVTLVFPIRNVKELERYEVFVGLQMSEAELQYNRQRGNR